MANPYTDRLDSLNSKRVTSNVRQISDMIGLPIRKPGQEGQIVSPSGVPVGRAPINQEPQEDESYKNTAFYANFDYHRQNDPHFNNLSNEMTQMATGLRKQVEAGYMPQEIAQDRLQQFIHDSFGRRAVAQPHLERQAQQQAQQQDTQGRASMLLNQIAQRAVQNPTDSSAMMNPDVGQNDAIQNLSEQQAPAQPQPQGGLNG